MAKTNNKKEVNKNQKLDAGKVFTKVMAAVLALLMVVSVAGTLIFYLVQQ